MDNKNVRKAEKLIDELEACGGKPAIYAVEPLIRCVMFLLFRYIHSQLPPKL